MVSDSELAVAAASGDRGALGDIYDRYANTLFELCRMVLGDPHEASDALQDTFVIAATRLGGLRDPSRLKPWLCAIARHESLRRSSKRARSRPMRDEVLDVPVADTAASGLMADDAASLVWESAESLTERERTVLVLNVRQGLEGAELAAAAGLPGRATSVLLSRAKTQLATAVRCTLLVRRGRDDCVELAALVPRKHAAIDALTRKRVARHASSCPTCATKWNATPEALGVLAAAPLFGAPVALRHETLNDPRLISFSSPLGDGDWQRDGFPPAEPDASRRRAVIGLVTAVVAIVAALGLVAASAGNDGPRVASPRSGATTTDPSDLEEFAPWPTDPKTQQTVTTAKGATTTTAKRATTTTRPATGGGSGPTTPPPAPTTTAVPRLIISAGATDNTLECGQATTVQATTSGREMAPGEGLLLHARDSSGSGSTVSMSRRGDRWVGNLGPFSTPGTVTWSVSSSDGNYAPNNHTIDVVPSRSNPC